VSRVAVTAVGPDLSDSVDERFGRARYVQFVDVESLRVASFDNAENRNALQGAGLAAAELVSARGATAVITGHLGPKAKSALEEAGIAGYQGTGMSVREAVEALRQGRLGQIREDS
jgi:predicted Fe-Mo cluster-binding NifX family protein